MPAGILPEATWKMAFRMVRQASAQVLLHYTLELFALDAKLDVPAGTPKTAAATREAVMKAIDGHALGKAVLVGRNHQ